MTQGTVPTAVEAEPPRASGVVLWYNATTGNGQLRPAAGDADIFFRRDDVTFVRAFLGLFPLSFPCVVHRFPGLISRETAEQVAAGEAPTPATALEPDGARHRPLLRRSPPPPQLPRPRASHRGARTDRWRRALQTAAGWRRA